MPKLVKKGNVWKVEYFDRRRGFTTRLSLGTDDVGLARRLYAEWVLKNSEPERGSLASVTVTGLVARFYTEQKHLPSRYAYKAAAKHCAEILKDMSLERFDNRRTQEEFVTALREKGLAEGTIKRIVAAISTAVKRAWQDRLIPVQVPIISVQDDAHRERVATDDELRTLLDPVQDEIARRYVAVALLTGARSSAVLRLTRAQFDFDRKLVHLLPEGERQVKGKAKPIIPLCSALERIVKPLPDGPLFSYMVQTDHGNCLRQYKTHRAVWERLKGCPNEVTPYTLRHTTATALRTYGVPEADISGYLGHRWGGSRTTERYSHYRPDYMRAAADAMDKFWGRVTGETNANVTMSGLGSVGAGEGSEGHPRSGPAAQGDGGLYH